MKKIALVFLGMISWLHEVVGQSSERNSRNKGKYPTLTENFLEWGDLEGFLKRHTFPANVTSKELQARNHVRILTNACMENANNPTGQKKDGGLHSGSQCHRDLKELHL